MAHGNIDINRISVSQFGDGVGLNQSPTSTEPPPITPTNLIVTRRSVLTFQMAAVFFSGILVVYITAAVCYILASKNVGQFKEPLKEHRVNQNYNDQPAAEELCEPSKASQQDQG